MDSGVHECGICNENYNSSNRKPLFLECGHTCCLFCMTQMERPSGINCPRCRKFTPKQVSQLPVNFDLIPAGDQVSADTTITPVARCGYHGLDFDHLCADCGHLVCQYCKEDVHFGHKVESLEKIVGSASATDTRMVLRRKLQAKMDRLTTSLTGPREALQMIEEIKTDVEEWRDSLLNSQSSVERDLKLWDALGSCPVQVEAVKEVVHRTNMAELSEGHRKFQIGAKLDELSKKYFVRGESYVSASELLPHRGIWRVNTEAVAADAILSVRAGRRPAMAIVTSWPTNPLQQVPQLLEALGEASKSIDLRLMDFFWMPSSEKDLRLQAFIQKHGNKVGGFLGSPEDAMAVCLAKGEAGFVVGVRLANMIDVDSCATLTPTPRSVCCIKSLPVEAGVRFEQLRWRPQRWHFPDIQDGDLDWIHKLTKRIMPCVAGTTLILPRCRLTEDGLSTLLKKHEGHLCFLRCAPVSLSRTVRNRIEHLARKKSINLSWKEY